MPPYINAYIINPFGATAPASPFIPLTVNAGATSTTDHVRLLRLFNILLVSIGRIFLRVFLIHAIYSILKVDTVMLGPTSPFN